MLRDESGIADEVIAERGYRSIDGASGYAELKAFGFSKQQATPSTGLLLPLHTTNGQQPLTIYRSDHPQPDANGRPRKYLFPKGASVRLDCPPRCQPFLVDPSIPLWLTEGQKKADALASHGAVALCLLGVWNFKGKNPLGGTTFLADWDYVALNGREVRLVFDSDIVTLPSVRKAVERLTEHLSRKGAAVRIVYLPPVAGKKVGVDDYLVAGHTLQELEALIEAPRLKPEPAKPVIELLPAPPKTLSRLLAWIDGHAYAVTWLPLKITITEYVNRQGEIEHVAQPQPKYEQRLFVMRDDGVLYGDTIDPQVKALPELGIDIAPMDKPPNHVLWTTAGVTAYLHKHRPDPVDVFTRLVTVYDHFLDFSRSLDEQMQMCRLSACISLMTWFADAFTVLPYPWPNSPAPGSGKTKWGHCWAGTSYLGYLTSASGSFAALRDLADLGATILFDDAEVLADPQKADPDKQMLILAGNRKGVCIPVKEQGSDRRWHTRWLNAYCPRGFTSLRLPFQALQSRSIVIPLVASADHTRANRDPQNAHDWPVDQPQLVADLWALGLWLQHEAADLWNLMSAETSVVGRDWERWRAIMTVARLLEQHGVAHLTADMWKIMSGYQEQKDDLEGTSRIVLVIRALMRLVKLPEADKWTSADVSDMSETRVRVQASQVVDLIRIALQEDSEDEDEGAAAEDEGKQKTARWPNAKAVGIILSKLRLPKDRETSSGRGRHRLISQKEVCQLAIAHHLVHLTDNMSDMAELVHLSDEPSPSDCDDVPLSDTPLSNGANGAVQAEPCPQCGEPQMPQPETLPDGSTAFRCARCGWVVNTVPF
jgi:hypothetical protein